MLQTTNALPEWANRPRHVEFVSKNGTKAVFHLSPPDDVLKLLAAYGEEQQPRAMAGVRSLFARNLEGCALGHKGTMCSQCVQGYFKNALGQCRECPEPEEQGIMPLLQRVAIAVGLLVVFGGLLFNTWRSQNNKGSPAVVVAAKILFTHLQTVGIINSVDIQFPEVMGQFFGGASVGSSAATSGMALECSLDNTSDPVG